MTNTQETTNLLSIDEILRNLKKDAHFYDRGLTEDDYMEMEQRD
jgi:hypothetical protein